MKLSHEKEATQENNKQKQEQKVSHLTQVKRETLEQDLINNYDSREILEKIRTHFESHNTMPDEKVFKERVEELLNDPNNLNGWDPDGAEKEDLAHKYAKTEIRETKFIGGPVVDMTKPPMENPETGKEVKQYKQPEENKFKLTPFKRDFLKTPEENIYTLDVELRKIKDGVNIYAKTNPDAARFTKIGSLPDNFLTNNPMNVSRCPAQICIEDYSGGKLRNVSERLVVETSRMSGDYVELDNDMLSGLNTETKLEQ